MGEELIRASDAEREAAVGTLRDAVGEGRLTLEELAERVERALTARTRADVAATTSDLPAPPAGVTRPRPTRWLVGILGGMDRAGRWRVGRRVVVVNLMGGCDLDLRDAVIEDDETEILVVSIMGGSDIVVPEGVEVELGGLALLGGNDLKARGPAPAPGAPVVRIRAYSLMGGTDVVTKPRRRSRRELPPGEPGSG